MDLKRDLEHDSFSFAGNIHGTGRSQVKTRLEVLFRPAVRITADAQQVRLRWMAKAGRTYQVFTASDLQGSWNEGPIFQGDGAEKEFVQTKPAGVTKRFYKVAVW